MIFRRLLTAASLLLLVVKVFSGPTLTCNRGEYQTGNECCTMCPAGSRVETDCTNEKTTSCLPCLEGTFTNQPNGLKQCLTCTHCDAGHGLKMKRSCTAVADAACEPLEGFYCVEPSDDGCNAAGKHASCEPGQYVRKEGTSSTDTVCSDCSDGTFSDGTFTSCRPHTQCGTKKLQLLKPGTSSTDAECGEERSNKTIIVIIILVSLVIVLSVVGLFLFSKRKKIFLKNQRAKEETDPVSFIKRKKINREETIEEHHREAAEREQLDLNIRVKEDMNED